MKKKYRIIDSFTYRGSDGKDKRSVVLGPGEQVPKLDSNEVVRLLRSGKICEIDQYGANIRYTKLNDLNDNQIDNLLKKQHTFVMRYLAGVQGSTHPLSKDTLAKMYSVAEERKAAPILIKQIEKFLSE